MTIVSDGRWSEAKRWKREASFKGNGCAQTIDQCCELQLTFFRMKKHFEKTLLPPTTGLICHWRYYSLTALARQWVLPILWPPSQCPALLSCPCDSRWHLPSLSPGHPDISSPHGEYLYSGDMSPHPPNLYPAPCLCRNTHALTPGSRVTPDIGEQRWLINWCKPASQVLLFVGAGWTLEAAVSERSPRAKTPAPPITLGSHTFNRNPYITIGHLCISLQTRNLALYFPIYIEATCTSYNSQTFIGIFNWSRRSPHISTAAALIQLVSS